MEETPKEGRRRCEDIASPHSSLTQPVGAAFTAAAKHGGLDGETARACPGDVLPPALARQKRARVMEGGVPPPVWCAGRAPSGAPRARAFMEARRPVVRGTRTLLARDAQS